MDQKIKYFEDIVIGLNGLVGCNLNCVIEKINSCAQKFNYETISIVISDALVNKEENKESLGSLELKMERGDILRTKTLPEILGMYAIAKIKKERKENKKCIWIIRQLKREEEIQTLKDIYGSNFFLIGVHCPEKRRRENLKKLSIDDASIDNIINRDRIDISKKSFGQSAITVFHQSDLFVEDINCDKEINRFLEIIMGYPYHTPTKNEFFMFQAFTSSLKSAELSRQVGSVFVSKDDDILSYGCNEVPKFGGGEYWPEDDNLDQRDFKLEIDSNTNEKNKIIKSIVSDLTKKDKQSSDQEYANDIDKIFSNISLQLNEESITSLPTEKNTTMNLVSNTEVNQEKQQPEKKSDEINLVSNTEVNQEIQQAEKKSDEQYAKILENSRLKDLTEFGRVVHSEMNAITRAAKNGIRIKGSTAYVTLMPCHNCTKHMIAAGIEKVVYIEPYDKSLAFLLHGDAVTYIDDNQKVSNRITFEPFLGIAPKRFSDLFSMNFSNRTKPLKRKNDKTGKTLSLSQNDTQTTMSEGIYKWKIIFSNTLFDSISLLEESCHKSLLEKIKSVTGSKKVA